MKIPDPEATFLAEALSDLPDKEQAIGFLALFVSCPSAVVREGALIGLGHLRKYARAKDLIRCVMEHDTDKDLRKMAAKRLLAD